MRVPASQSEHAPRWGQALAIANAAVIVAMLVMVTSGHLQTLQAFLRSWAYGALFASLTTCLGVVFIRFAVDHAVAHGRSVLPIAVTGCLVIVAVGCLAAPVLLRALALTPVIDYWSDYWRTLKTVLPLALVFGFGAFVYSSLAARVQRAERRLREKELAEEKTKTLAAEARLRSLESWIHPHFLFNTLNSISALIAVDPVRAEKIVGRFATLFRASLDASGRSLVPMAQEMAFVESYLDIERARLGERLRSSVDVPAEFAAVPVPPMTVQSLVENAIKHAIALNPAGGEVRVSVHANEGNIVVCVRDTGVGFDLAELPTRHGLDKLVQRLDVLYEGKAGLRVSRDSGSCTVEMIIPRT